jgi:hypothetical protein
LRPPLPRLLVSIARMLRSRASLQCAPDRPASPTRAAISSSDRPASRSLTTSACLAAADSSAVMPVLPPLPFGLACSTLVAFRISVGFSRDWLRHQGGGENRCRFLRVTHARRCAAPHRVPGARGSARSRVFSAVARIAESPHTGSPTFDGTAEGAACWAQRVGLVGSSLVTQAAPADFRKKSR